MGRKRSVLGLATLLAVVVVPSWTMAQEPCQLADLRGGWGFAISGVATNLTSGDPLSVFGFKCTVVLGQRGNVRFSRCDGDRFDPEFEPLEFEVLRVSRKCTVTAIMVMDTQALIPDFEPEGRIGCTIEGYLSLDRNFIAATSHCSRNNSIHVSAVRLHSR